MNGSDGPFVEHPRLGRLPVEWLVRPFREVTAAVREAVVVVVENTYREIGIRSHGKGIFHKDPTDGVKLGDKRVFSVKPSCLIFNIVFAWEGAVAATSPAEAGMIGSHRFPMYQPHMDIADVEFLLRFFKTRLGVRLLGDASPGGAGRNRTLNQKLLADTPIPLPPLTEQRKIAAILSSVDEVIEKTEAVIEQLQVVKKAMMQELLTRGLPGRHTRFKKTEIGEIPEEWEVVSIGSLCAPQKSALVNGPFGSDLLKSELCSSGVPVIYIRDIRNGAYLRVSDAYVTDEKFRELSTFRVIAGDLLIAKVGDPPGIAAVYPANEPDGIVTQDVVRLRPDVAKTTGAFLRWYLNAPVGIDQIALFTIEGTRKRFALGSFRSELRVALPTLPEQRAIADCIDAIQNRIESEKLLAVRLGSTKSALAMVLLTGELRVTPTEAAA